MSKRLGYVRVSTLDQNTDRQLEGVALDKLFLDKASGKDVERPALRSLLEYARDGDVIYVHSMDRLARNLDDLRRIVHDLAHRGIEIHFVKEQITFSGEENSMAKLLLSIMGAFAEFERALIRERQKEGIEQAKKRGAYRGRKPSLGADQISELKARAHSGEKKTKLAEEFGISRETLYQYLRG